MTVDNINSHTYWNARLEKMLDMERELESHTPDSFPKKEGVKDYIQTLFRLHSLADHFHMLAYMEDIDRRLYLGPAQRLCERVEKLISKLYGRETIKK